MTRFRMGMCACVVALATGTLTDPASAQTEPEAVTPVDIDFDIGPYDPTIADWPVDAVLVTGDIDAGQELTVEVRGEGDVLLWSATGDVTSTTTRFAVEQVLAVGDVTSAGLSAESLTEVLGEVIERPDADLFRSGSGGSGSGQIALSMILALVVAALVFRTPLPSTSTQRWRK